MLKLFVQKTYGSFGIEMKEEVLDFFDQLENLRPDNHEKIADAKKILHGQMTKEEWETKYPKEFGSYSPYYFRIGSGHNVNAEDNVQFALAGITTWIFGERGDLDPFVI